MTTQHHKSFTKSVFGSATRLFRSNKANGLLDSSQVVVIDGDDSFSLFQVAPTSRLFVQFLVLQNR